MRTASLIVWALWKVQNSYFIFWFRIFRLRINLSLPSDFLVVKIWETNSFCSCVEGFIIPFFSNFSISMFSSKIVIRNGIKSKVANRGSLSNSILSPDIVCNTFLSLIIVFQSKRKRCFTSWTPIKFLTISVNVVKTFLTKEQFSWFFLLVKLEVEPMKW